jgi:periplasmic divalent cation tolerance protein
VTDGQFCQVVTTTDSREAAEALAHGVVEARMAACAQIVGPITSIYWWEATMATAEEWQVVLKTTMDRYPQLAEHIRARHSYDVPEILCVPVATGNPAYLEWLAATTRTG